ncbi:MAG: DNA polymerase III subunit delta [Chlorobi bacterium]|jgi:DNA polymerase-3 subunit delta|nr:DNA polymerase III subunit delta [Chlorobiota bacterium]
MPIVTSESLMTQLRHGKIEPLYFLFGDEEFLIDEALEQIIDRAVDKSTVSFNFDLLHGTEVTLQEIVERASAYPLMADRRVVVVRDIDRTFSLRGKPDPTSPFVRYITSASPSTTLVLTAVAGDILKGKSPKAPYNIITEHAASIQFKKIYDRELPSWTANRIRTRGKEITPDAVELFVSYAGGSLRIISNEIEKLFTYVEGKKNITLEDVRTVVGTSKTWNIFELQKALGTKNASLASEITERMLRAGEPEQLILTMLTRYFTILWRLTELRARTRDQNEMARAVGITSFFLNEYLAAVQRYPIDHLRNTFQVLLQADILLKSSNLSGSVIMQMMLASITQGKDMMPYRERR